MIGRSSNLLDEAQDFGYTCQAPAGQGIKLLEDHRAKESDVAWGFSENEIASMHPREQPLMHDPASSHIAREMVEDQIYQTNLAKPNAPHSRIHITHPSQTPSTPPQHPQPSPPPTPTPQA